MTCLWQGGMPEFSLREIKTSALMNNWYELCDTGNLIVIQIKHVDNLVDMGVYFSEIPSRGGGGGKLRISMRKVKDLLHQFLAIFSLKLCNFFEKFPLKYAIFSYFLCIIFAFLFFPHFLKIFLVFFKNSLFWAKILRKFQNFENID